MAVPEDKAEDVYKEELRAGTGFMQGLADTIRNLNKFGGYTKNLTAKEDHFECCSGEFKLYPKDFVIEKVMRFENSSDPDDTAILYAISDPTQNIKGLYVDSYGAGQEPLSREMIDKMKSYPEEPEQELQL